MSQLETRVESFFFKCRWLLAPFFFGLMLAIGALLIKFCKEMFHLLSQILSIPSQELMVSILTLVDTA